jgi:hypothetical protein
MIDYGSNFQLKTQYNLILLTQTKRFRSLTSGKYRLQNKDSHAKYKVYCHMAEISGCGNGGWTLVMKVDGNEVNHVVQLMHCCRLNTLAL